MYTLALVLLNAKFSWAFNMNSKEREFGVTIGHPVIRNFPGYLYRNTLFWAVIVCIRDVKNVFKFLKIVGDFTGTMLKRKAASIWSQLWPRIRARKAIAGWLPEPKFWIRTCNNVNCTAYDRTLGKWNLPCQIDYHRSFGLEGERLNLLLWKGT